LLRQKVGAAIVGSVIDDQEMPDAQAAIIVEEVVKSRPFVADDTDGQNRRCADPVTPVADQSQFPRFAPGSQNQPPPLEP
jgi:hypothetical protein